MRDSKNGEVTKQAIIWLVIFTGTNFSLNRSNLPWFDSTSRGQTVCALSGTVEVSVQIHSVRSWWTHRLASGMAKSCQQKHVSDCHLCLEQFHTFTRLLVYRIQVQLTIKKAVTIQWTGLLDWTTGLDYWTHGNCLWRRKEQDYTEIHTAIQESRVIFHCSQHVVLNSVRSWCKCAIKNWSHNPGNKAK